MKRRLPIHACLLVGAAMGLSLPRAARAQSEEIVATGPQTVEDLQTLSIEDLANIQVSTVSKRLESLARAPAAIYVITAEDIRASGATSLPEALRLAPNLEVARLNGYAWTVTARGFNSPETANKLLVMVNGRSVYEPIGGGVLWQQVDVDLANLDHIEVISGPGGTLWGANAVNGVINLITKDASKTAGLYAQVSDSAFERSAAVRYGGRISDNVTFKLIADAFESDATLPATATDTSSDAFRGTFGSFSLGGTWGRDTLTAGIGAYDNRMKNQGGHLTGSVARMIWSRDLGDGSSLNVNAVVSNDERDEPTLYERRDSVVLGAQQDMGAKDRHHFVWGGEYRYWWENFVSYNIFQFAQPKTNIGLGSVFVQDEIALRPDLRLTVGLKGEYSSYSGVEWLPNARLAWQRGDGSLLWAAVSRAARTPNRIERELHADPFLVPSPDFASEKLTAWEAGWRAQPVERLSLSLSAFYNSYDDLRTDGYPPTIFPIILQNGGRGRTWGLEGWGTYDAAANWRLSAGFNLLRKSFELKPGYNDLANLSVQGQDPRYQAQIRSQWRLSRAVDLSVTLRRVGKIDNAPVPAYTEASAHLGWRISDKIELAVDGLNLMHARHLEAWDPSTLPARYIPRSVFVTLRYGY